MLSAVDVPRLRHRTAPPVNIYNPAAKLFIYIHVHVLIDKRTFLFIECTGRERSKP
jgi:hypothetical protein